MVAGTQGGIGRNAFEHLIAPADWRVRGVSRRAPLAAGGEQLVADLLDPLGLQAALATAADTTHLIFAAYQERADPLSRRL